jgi:hypothetical protein
MNKLLAFTLALLAAGCTDDRQQDTTSATTREKAEAVARKFEGDLLEIARTYQSYGRLAPEPLWAPLMCDDIGLSSPVVPVLTGSLAVSRSGDQATHGRKLYSLFVKEMPEDEDILNAYTVQGKPSPVGQVVVKEAWAPEEVKDGGRKLEPLVHKVKVREGGRLVEREDRFVPYARGKDGRLYHAREKAALFIMFKLDPQTPGTDEGWVYGTVTADGKRVTSAGRVESCMGCHKDAPHDRLFGLPEGK